MAIVVTVSPTVYQNKTMLITTNQTLENTPPFIQFFPFTMVIRNMFATNDTKTVAFSDNALDTIIPLIDKLNKPVAAIELINYAGTRRQINCVYDSIYQVIRVCSPICPTLLSLPEPQAPVVDNK